MTSTVRDTPAFKIAGKLSNQGLIRRSDIGKVRAVIEQMLKIESLSEPVTPPQTAIRSIEWRMPSGGGQADVIEYIVYKDVTGEELCAVPVSDLPELSQQVEVEDVEDEVEEVEEEEAETPQPAERSSPSQCSFDADRGEKPKIATADEVYKRQQAIPSLRQPKNTMYQKRITVVIGFSPMSVARPLEWRGVDFSDKRMKNYSCGYCESQMYNSAVLREMLWKHYDLLPHLCDPGFCQKIGVRSIMEIEDVASRWLKTIIPYEPTTFDERAETRRPSSSHFLGIVQGLDGVLGFRLPDAETFILGRRDPYSSPFLNGVWFERWPTEKELMCLIAMRGPANAFCFGIPNEFHTHGN